MGDSSKKNTQGKETYIYDTEGHYTWYSSFTEALKDVRKSIARKEQSWQIWSGITMIRIVTDR